MLQPLSNFAFLETAWPDLYEPAREAELHVWSAPRLAALSGRIALENAIRWVFDHDSSLTLPYQDNLATLLHEATFRNLIGSTRFQGANYVRKLGNQAAHQKVSPSSPEAFDALRHLYGFLTFVAAAYSAERPSIAPFDETLLGPAANAADTTLAEAQQQEATYLAQQEELARKDTQLAANAQLLSALQEQLAAMQQLKAHNLANPVSLPVAISEAETRRRYIDLLLREAGWDVTAANVQEYEVSGMPLSTNPSGKGYVDYVLWDDNGLPLAVVEAKKTMAEPTKGRYQATLYANCLEQMTGQRPVVFTTNGFETSLLDDHPATNYPPRRVAGFLGKDELRRMILRRSSRQDLTQMTVSKDIAGRYYQNEAIRRVAARFQTQKQRGALLVMATGAGKTRTAAALVDVLLRAGWVTRVLFLADRKALVRQAKNAFAEHLPNLSMVNITQEKEDLNSRMVFSTYPTMMNRIDGETGPGNVRAYGPGFFDLIIIDEAHRSVYQKYQAIFEYFDSLLIGLTATPLAQIDRNTYELFGLEDHQPTYAYELTQAVKDRFLVPPRGMSVPLKFQRQGIKYNELSDQEKEEYEEEFRDEATGLVPDSIEANALNAWLFNQHTVDEVLRYVLDKGVKVEGGDKLGKTILFARSHRHAVFIEERFHKLFPHLGNGFVRVIDNEEKYAQALLDDFSETNKQPQLAISVDMLDTGIDIPDVVNLVFFKAVRSSAKFWQMVGRGTRLRPDLFGPGQHKAYFTIFDFCENFEFFEAQPEGVTASAPIPLSQQIFVARLTLAEILRRPEYTEPADQQLRQELLDTLHGQVAGLDRQTFAVRARLRYVEEFGELRTRWDALTKVDVQNLENQLAHLAPVEGTDELARRFDLLLLNLMLALVQKSARQKGYVERISNLGYNLLSQKASVPAVFNQKDLLQQVQRKEYWQQATLPGLDDVRQKLRDLVKFLDRDQQPVVYTHFTDELDLAGVTEKDIHTWGSQALESYHQRVARYIRENQHHVTIHRLRTNQPITTAELAELERLVFDGQERGTPADLQQELGTTPPPLGVFVRGILGLDLHAAKEAFAQFLHSHTLQADQIYFVNSLIDYLAHNGTVDRSRLFEQPFTARHDQGVTGVFREEAQVRELFRIVDFVNQNALALA